VFPAASAGAIFQFGDVEREVPGRDQPDHTDRLAERHRHAVALDRHCVAEELVHGTRVVADHVDDHRQLAACVGDRHAHVPTLEQRQLLGVLLDQVREAVHRAAAGDRRQRSPLLVGADRRSHRPVEILDVGLGNVRQVRAGGRVQHLEAAAVGRLAALTRDQQALCDGGGHRCSFPGGYIRSKPRNRSQSVTAASNVRCSIRA
jgi:hypothetical protein